MTPVFEPRRFNARFFVAELPAGQVTRDVSTESDQVVWLPVREAIRAVDDARDADAAADVLHLPGALRLAATADALAAAERPGPAVGRAAGVVDDEGAYLSIPDRLVARRGRRGADAPRERLVRRHRSASGPAACWRRTRT